MSEAIRCEACRWWRHIDDDKGACELLPSKYIGGQPGDATNWYQPRTLADEGCSRGEPKTQKTGGDK